MAGLCLAGAAVSAWSVPPGGGLAGSEVSMLANLTGELEVSPAGKPFLRDGFLLPGDPARGTLEIRDQTPKPLLVSLRAAAETPDLVRLLQVEIRAGERLVYRGTLAGLRRPVRDEQRLEVGAARRLSFRAWLPEGSGERSGNRAAETTLELLSAPVGGRS